MRNLRIRLALIGAIFFLLLGFPRNGISRVNVELQVNLPLLVIFAPPVVAVIPETYVYFCPDVEEDLFFYAGYWYRSYEGDWYRANGYNGPWVHITGANVPRVFYRLPPNYRTMSGYSYRHIPYRDLTTNWKTWQRGKYWEKHGWERHDLNREREHGVAPPFGGSGKGHH
jgi:hypothetical protein